MIKNGLKCVMCEGENLALGWVFISEYNLFIECKDCGRMYRLGQSKNEFATVFDFVKENGGE